MQDNIPPHIDGPGAVRAEQVDTQVAAEHMITTNVKTNGGEVTPAVVLGSKRKAESDVPLSPTGPTFSNDDPHYTVPKRIPDSIMDEGRPMSPLSELTESESDAQHPTDMTTPDNIPAPHTPYNLNGRPTRSASHKERLTELAEDLNAYEDHETHMFSLGTAEYPPQQIARRGAPRPQVAYRSSSFPKKKHRHSKKKPTKSGMPTGTPSTPNGASSGPSSGTLLYVPPDPAAVPPSTSLTATLAKSKRVTAKKPKLRTVKKPRVQLNADLPSRPSKRSRGEDSLGVVDAQVGSIDGSSIGQPKLTGVAGSQQQAGDVEKVRTSSVNVHTALVITSWYHSQCSRRVSAKTDSSTIPRECPVA